MGRTCLLRWWSGSLAGGGRWRARGFGGGWRGRLRVRRTLWVSLRKNSARKSMLWKGVMRIMRNDLPADTLYPGIFSPIFSPTIPIPIPLPLPMNPLPTIPIPIPLSPTLALASPSPFPASESHSQSQSPLPNPTAQSSSNACAAAASSSTSTSTGSLSFLGSRVRVLEAFPWRKELFGEGIQCRRPAAVSAGQDVGGQSFSAKTKWAGWRSHVLKGLGAGRRGRFLAAERLGKIRGSISKHVTVTNTWGILTMMVAYTCW